MRIFALNLKSEHLQQAVDRRHPLRAASETEISSPPLEQPKCSDSSSWRSLATTTTLRLFPKTLYC